MIEHALNYCDMLTVLVCCSDKELISSELRGQWIRDTFKQEDKVEVIVLNYLEIEYPNTSESSQETSRTWSKKFKQLFPDHSLLITSEPYGNYVASFMGISHIAFDLNRAKYPVSATAIRRNPYGNWDFIPSAVKPYFLKKVVLLGTESTGKTTLTEMLASYFGASKVLEAGRDIIKNSKEFKYEDLYAVAQDHANRIAKSNVEASPLLFIDTDVHITRSYARFMFKKDLELPQEIIEQSKAAVYLYLNNDVPHIQDGTRLGEAERNFLDKSHRQTLLHYGIKYHEIKGNWHERLADAVNTIKIQLDI